MNKKSDNCLFLATAFILLPISLKADIITPDYLSSKVNHEWTAYIDANSIFSIKHCFNIERDFPANSMNDLRNCLLVNSLAVKSHKKMLKPDDRIGFKEHVGKMVTYIYWGFHEVTEQECQHHPDPKDYLVKKKMTHGRYLQPLMNKYQGIYRSKINEFLDTKSWGHPHPVWQLATGYSFELDIKLSINFTFSMFSLSHDEFANFSTQSVTKVRIFFLPQDTTEFKSC